jgi:hypothetical protein
MATAVAGLFAAGVACKKESSTSNSGSAASSSGEMVKCQGVNECKGKGACGGADHTCAGQNECKGKGWIKISQAECEEKGGEAI